MEIDNMSKPEAMDSPLRVAIAAHYPSGALISARDVRERHSMKEHPSSWIRAICRSIKERDDIDLRVFVHSRAVKRRCTAMAQGTRIEFLPRRIPLRCDPFLFHWPMTCSLSAALREFRPHVVHAFGTEGGYGLSATRLRYPCIVSIQGIVSLLRPYFRDNRLAWTLQEYLERLSVRRADCVLAQTRFVESWVLSVAPHARVSVLPRPVNAEFLSVEAGPKPPDALSIGTFAPWKNMGAAIHAFALADVPDATLTLIGDGPERAECEALASRLGVRMRTRFLGSCPRERVLQQMRNARFLVLTSRMDSAPNVIIEAHAAGLPVVATVCGGVPELVEDGKDGFLTAQDDGPALAARMRRLFADANLASQMGCEGRRTVLARHAPSVIGPQLARLYRETAAAGKAPGSRV
jgi:glycosyltransferase involved in cell wall biosynthesis